ncbi:MAG TPA: site-specific integrase [Solirubrobacteraceae bacterium]|nr:site-specific integrase [Solirubrobacteraceae bacterium]
MEYELIARNPARGRRRRLRTLTPYRSWLDRADHIAALLDAAGELDREARVGRRQRRAILATLVFAGLRIGDALSLQWCDVDLPRGTITIRASKTPAGVRDVNLLGALRDELAEQWARFAPARDAFVFATSNGTRQDESTVRRRVLARAVARANAKLRGEGTEPLPDRLTPHSLRRTFASLLFALDEPPPYLMAQLGHTTANLTLTIYARQMNRRNGEAERLRALAGCERSTVTPSRSALPPRGLSSARLEF